MQTRGRIDHHVSQRQLRFMNAVGVLDDQVATVIVFGRSQKEGRREVAAHAVRASLYMTDRVVYMRAKGLPTAITVEERWEDLHGQSGRDEERILAKRGEDHVTDLHCRGMALGDLQIIFGLGRLMAGSHAAIYPLSRSESSLCVRYLIGGQDMRNRNQHCCL